MSLRFVFRAFILCAVTMLSCARSSSDQHESLVRFAPVMENQRVAGGLWLFAVDDGDDSSVVLSREDRQGIELARMDLSRPAAGVAWRRVLDAANAGGLGIADHWHVYAHGSHWISFAAQGGASAWLMELDRSFRPISSRALVVQERHDAVRSRQQGAPRGFTPHLVTNDHFMVAEANGVAIGFGLMGTGTLRLFRVSAASGESTIVDIGGGADRMANGSSATAIDGGFRVFGTESLNMIQEGVVKIIDYDSSWRAPRIAGALTSEMRNFAMAAGVRLSDGSWIVVARRNEARYSRGERPPPTPTPGARLEADDGAIVRFIIEPDGSISSTEVLAERGNRPHIMVKDDLVITTWDGAGCWMRIDRVTR